MCMCWGYSDKHFMETVVTEIYTGYADHRYGKQTQGVLPTVRNMSRVTSTPGSLGRSVIEKIESKYKEIC